MGRVVSKSKDTSFLKAIHNVPGGWDNVLFVVSKSKDTSFLKAIHNLTTQVVQYAVGCFKEQRYKFFESNSQLISKLSYIAERLFQRAKIQVF